MALRLALILTFLLSAPQLVARDIPLPPSAVGSPSLGGGFSIAGADEGFLASWDSATGVYAQRFTLEGAPADALSLLLDTSSVLGSTFAVRANDAWLVFWATSADLRVARISDDGSVTLRIFPHARLYDVTSDGTSVLLAVRDVSYGVGLRIYYYDDGRLVRSETISNAAVRDARIIRTESAFELWWQAQTSDGSIRIARHPISAGGVVGPEDRGLIEATQSAGPIGVAASGTDRLIVFRETSGKLNARIQRESGPDVVVDLGTPTLNAGDFRVAGDPTGWWVVYRAGTGSSRSGTHLVRVRRDGNAEPKFLTTFAGDIAIATHELMAGMLWEDGAAIAAGFGTPSSGIRRTATPGEGAATQAGERAFSTPAGGLAVWKEWNGSAWSLHGAWVIDRAPLPEVEGFEISRDVSELAGFDVAWNGTHAVIAWHAPVTEGVDRILARRFLPGTVIDAAPVEIGRGSSLTGPSIASAGDGTSVATWIAAGEVGSIHFASLSGLTLAGPPVGMHARVGASSPDIAWNGANYLVVWATSTPCPILCPPSEAPVWGLTVSQDGQPVGASHRVGASEGSPFAEVVAAGDGWAVFAAGREVVRVGPTGVEQRRLSLAIEGRLQRHSDGSIALASGGAKIELHPDTLEPVAIKSIPLGGNERSTGWFARPLRAGGFEEMALVRNATSSPLVARTFSPAARRVDLAVAATLDLGRRRLTLEIENRGTASVERTSLWLSFVPSVLTSDRGTVVAIGSGWRIDAPLAPGQRVRLTVELGAEAIGPMVALVAPDDALDPVGANNLVRIEPRVRTRPARR